MRRLARYAGSLATNQGGLYAGNVSTSGQYASAVGLGYGLASAAYAAHHGQADLAQVRGTWPTAPAELSQALKAGLTQREWAVAVPDCADLLRFYQL